MAAPSPRPPADNLVKEIVTIDKFRVPKFSSKDFIESLCYRHLQTAKSSRQKEFDPKPFIRTFESSIEVRVDNRMHGKHNLFLPIEEDIIPVYNTN